MTVKCPRSVYTLTLHRLFHFGTKCTSAFNVKIINGTNGVCKILSDPNCISSINYTEKCTITKYVLKVTKILITYDLF